MGVRYFPKGIFPRATSQVSISQMCKFPSVNFLKIMLDPLRHRMLKWGQALWLGSARGPSVPARTGGGEDCG